MPIEKVGWEFHIVRKSEQKRSTDKKRRTVGQYQIFHDGVKQTGAGLAGTVAETRGPGLTPLFPSSEDLALEIEAPSGRTLSASDPALPGLIGGDEFNASDLTIIRSDRAITDCRPLSLLATQTIDGIGRAVGLTLDKRRFRENLYIDLNSGESFAVDAFVGRRLRIGSKLTVHILERDIRCRMISIDPETLDENPAILRHVAKNHDGTAGVYAAVLVEGLVRPGDEIVLQD